MNECSAQTSGWEGAWQGTPVGWKVVTGPQRPSPEMGRGSVPWLSSRTSSQAEGVLAPGGLVEEEASHVPSGHGPA